MCLADVVDDTASGAEPDLTMEPGFAQPATRIESPQCSAALSRSTGDEMVPEPADFDPTALRPLPRAAFQDNAAPGMSAQGEVTVTGRFLYVDADGVTRPVMWATVEVWDADALLDDYLGDALTDRDGWFSAGPFENADGFGTLDVYVRVLAGSGAARINEPSGTIYDAYTATRENVPSGPLDLGEWQMPASEMGAWRIYENVLAGWDYLANASGVNYNTPYVVVLFPSDDGPYSHYHRGGEIHFPDDGSADKPDIVIHEYAHHVMYVAYGNWFPPDPCAGQSHQIWNHSNPRCAWTEGWAAFLPLAVSGDSMYTSTTPLTSGDLEAPPSWWFETDDVEGRVAAALYDILDPANDDPAAQGFVPIWQTLVAQRMSAFAEFWEAWKADGRETHTVVKAIHLNTIDYDTQPTLEGLLDLAMNAGTTFEGATDLWPHAYDPESSDEELVFSLTSVTSEFCGPSLRDDRFIDVNPHPGWAGTCAVTVSVSDGVKAATDTFEIFVIGNEPVCGNGNCERPFERPCSCPTDCGDLCGEVGLDKLVELVGCYSGPDAGADPACASTDHNSDGTVDLKDVALLFNAFNPPA